MRPVTVGFSAFTGSQRLACWWVSCGQNVDRQLVQLRRLPSADAQAKCDDARMSNASLCLRNGHQVGEYALPGLLWPGAWSDDGDLTNRIRLNGESIHHPIDAGKRICERQRKRLDARLQRHGFRSGAVAPRSGPDTGYQLDPTSIASRLLYRVCCSPGNATSDDLVERNSLAECNGGQDTNLGNDIMPLHIIGRVGFRISVGLRVGQCRGIVETLSHQCENVVRRPVQDSTHRYHACSGQTLPEGAEYGSARHDRGLHAELCAALPGERSQFQRRGGTCAFAGCNDMSAAFKSLSQVAKGRFGFARIRIASLSQHVALRLGKTF